MPSLTKSHKSTWILGAIFLSFALLSSSFGEVRTYEEVDEKYWKTITGEKDKEKIAKRYVRGRTIENEQFEVKNMSFNRRPHPNGKGDYLRVSFEMFNLKNKPFEGYMFIVASMDKRYKKGAHYYVIIDNISPKPSPNEDFNISQGFFPMYAKELASNENNKEPLGVLTQKELRNNQADDPTKGIPIKMDKQLPIDVKHFMPYSREQKFFNTVTILIYGKDKRKLNTFEIKDDPQKQGKKKFVRYKEVNEDNGDKSQYILEEKHPLLYARRFTIKER